MKNANADHNGNSKRYSFSHIRSRSAKKRRNKSRKEKRKLRKTTQLSNEIKKRILLESQVVKLQWQNRVLKKSLLENKRYSRFRNCISLREGNSSTKREIAKTDRVIRKFDTKLTILNTDDILGKQELSSGVFGTVKLAYLKSLQQHVAIKYFKRDSNSKETYVEALICKEFSGHVNFPFFFGVLPSREIVMEYIGESCTLQSSLKYSWLKSFFKIICCQVVTALNAMHLRGLLHNDLHGSNILIRKRQFVKIIDFGKCTLIDDPIIYNIRPGSDKQKKYNKYHTHLAYELRHVPGSKTSVESDIYSVGRNFAKVAQAVSNENLKKLSNKMTTHKPTERPCCSELLRMIGNL